MVSPTFLKKKHFEKWKEQFYYVLKKTLLNLDVRYFPKGFFLSGNFPSDNFPNCNFPNEQFPNR